MDIFAVILLSFPLASGFYYQSLCLLYNHTCVAECPTMMQEYHMRCNRDTTSQRTCSSPNAYRIGYTCGWSRCDCIGEMLLNEETNECVLKSSCPKYEVSHFARRIKKAKHKIEIPEKSNKYFSLLDEDDDDDDDDRIEI